MTAAPSNRILRLASAAAAIGILTVGCSPSSSLSQEPSTALPATATAGPSPASGDAQIPAGPIDAGTHTFRMTPAGSDGPILLTVTVPASWSSRDGWVLTRAGGIGQPGGVAIQFWGAPDYTYRDACHWSATQFAVEPTVDFMAEALAAQVPRDASTPREITQGAARAVEIQLSVPNDIALSQCDKYEGGGYFQSWHYGTGESARYHQGPGQQDLVRLVDIDGRLVIIDTATWPQLLDETRVEMTAVLDSISFELPAN